MMNLIKQLILRLLRKCGYVVLKEPDFQRMLATTGERMATLASEPPRSFQPIGPGTHAEVSLDADFRDVSEGAARDINPLKACALRSAVQHLTKGRVPGDIVDCGDGSSTILAFIAATLVALGDTSRRLVLFDVTGDPTHRAESELRVWGGNRDLLLDLDPPAPPTRSTAPPLPSRLIASGYPPERIFSVRYPYGSLDFTRAIAFLGLTSETYLANRAAIGALIPLVSSGGVVAAEADLSKLDRRDAVTDFLDRQAINLHLWHVTSTYRIGVKYVRSGQDGQSIAR